MQSDSAEGCCARAGKTDVVRQIMRSVLLACVWLLPSSKGRELRRPAFLRTSIADSKGGGVRFRPLSPLRKVSSRLRSPLRPLCRSRLNSLEEGTSAATAERTAVGVSPSQANGAPYAAAAPTTRVDGDIEAKGKGVAWYPEWSSDRAIEHITTDVSMTDLVSLCRRRGFVFQSSEIYNGMNGFWDYGPLGVEVHRNIKNRWWDKMVREREDIVGLDCSIIMAPKTWEASGHVGGFSDPMIDCKESKMRYRADQLYFARVELESGELLGYISMLDGDNNEAHAKKLVKTLMKKADVKGDTKPLELKDATQAAPEEIPLIPSPATGIPGSLTPPREFNLMFETSVGALSDAASKAYLRPETAQGIFVNFKNVAQTSRVKVPFGIAQIGKAFRNEINPRNFIFRSREFEQMEIEYFIPPDEDAWPEYYKQWIGESWDWLKSIGLREDLMSYDVHQKCDLAHYARACTDIIFKFPFGESELMGIAARGDFDLSQHEKTSGKSMEYFDSDPNAADKRRYVPHVIEPSLGVDRLFLAVMVSAYVEEKVDGEKRTYLKFHPSLAPYKAAVLPLVKNKPELVSKARGIFEKLKRRYSVFWDASGSIGRRYRRADEVGVPFAITVDFDSLQDDSVTVRDRDSCEQTRMKISDLYPFLTQQIDPW